MKCKIDIYESSERYSHDAKMLYYGSLQIETNRDYKYLLDYLHHAGKRFVVEGILINTYQHPDIMLIELTDFIRPGNMYENIILSCPEFSVLHDYFEERSISIGDEYIIIGNDLSAEEIAFIDSTKVENVTGSIVIKSDQLFEWGASAFFERYITSIASSLTVKLLEKLVGLNIPKESISTFKASQKLKNVIGREYGINPSTLILASYTKEGDTETIELRNIETKFNVKMKDKEIIELQMDKLNNYL